MPFNVIWACFVSKLVIYSQISLNQWEAGIPPCLRFRSPRPTTVFALNFKQIRIACVNIISTFIPFQTICILASTAC